MKKTKKEKIKLLNRISQPEVENSRWKEIARWNRDHAETLEDITIIASRILQTLKAKGMTQKQLAQKLEVSPQALTRIVKGRQNLTLQTIRKIEKVLDIALISVHRPQTQKLVGKVRFENTHINNPGKPIRIFSGNIDNLPSGSGKKGPNLKIA